RHRWIRGDWQILQWLLPRVPGADARRIKNPISTLSRWKILDNLRRSLIPAVALSLLFVAWLLLPAPMGLVATMFVLLVIGTPLVLSFLTGLLKKDTDVPFAAHAQ